MSMAANAGDGAVTPVQASVTVLEAPILAAPPAPSDDGSNSAADLLARPLFSASRRPPASRVGATTSQPRLMPRLTGVVVSPVGRVALFADAEGGRPLVMREGDHLGANVIEAIAAGQVTVRGPGGLAVLRSTFDESVAPAKPTIVAAPEVPIARKLPMPFRASPRPAGPTRP